MLKVSLMSTIANRIRMKPAHRGRTNRRTGRARAPGSCQRGTQAGPGRNTGCGPRQPRCRRRVIRRTRGRAQRIHHQDLPLPARRAGRARALPRRLARHRAGLRRHGVAGLDQRLLLHAGAQRLRRDAVRDGRLPDRDQGPRPAARGPDAQPGRDVRAGGRALPHPARGPRALRWRQPLRAGGVRARGRQQRRGAARRRRGGGPVRRAHGPPRHRASEATSSRSASRPPGWSGSHCGSRSGATRSSTTPTTARRSRCSA